MKSKPLSTYQHGIIATTLFFLAFVIYIRSQNTFLSDSMWTVHISSSIINDGNTDLDEYERIVVDNGAYGVTRIIDGGSYGVTHDKVKGHLYSDFPVGNSILAVPIIWVIEQIGILPEQQTFYQHLQQTSPGDPYLLSIQHFIASLIVALVSPVLYYIGYKRFDVTTAIIGVLVFAFGTSAYSTASRVLWQHGPSMLMLIIVLALFIKGEHNPRAIQWAGLPLAFSYIVRPTNSIPIIIFTIIVLIRYRKQFPGYLLGAMLVAIPFLWSNQLTYNYFLPPYYNPQRIGPSSHFREALLANLFSPSRGVFIFSPIMLFAIYGIIGKLKRMHLTLLEVSLIIIIFLHWLVISSFGHWWGGHSYGPRLFTDMMPYMTYFLMMGIYELNRIIMQPRTRLIGGRIFVVLAFVSIAIHFTGANQPAVFQWFAWPVELDSHSKVRLWDWGDLIFLRTIEDWPVTTTPIISFNPQTPQVDDLLHIPLHNIAEDSYLWEVKTPSSLRIVKGEGIDYGYAESGIPIAFGRTALLTQEYQWLPIAVEHPLNSFVDPSLGAIVVTIKTLLGEKVSTQVIPVSIINNGDSWQNANAISNQIWLPADIKIDSGKADSSLYGLYGSGWYAIESFEQYQWRWAQSPAELYIFSAKPRHLTLDITFDSIYDETIYTSQPRNTGELHISTGTEAWVGEIHVGEPNQIPIKLDKGWNTLLFKLEAGNFIPADLDTASSDRRPLSFSLNSINIITTD